MLQTDKQTARQTARQRARQTVRQTDRQTKTFIYTKRHTFHIQTLFETYIDK